MTKHADADKTVTHTSQPSKTVIRKDADADAAPAAEHPVAGHHVRQPGVPHPAPAPQPNADSPDANGPGQPQADATDPNVKATVAKAQGDHAESVSSVHTDTHHAPVDPGVHAVVTDAQGEANKATLEQLNGQLAAIRGLPQYADLERDLTERIAALTASRA